MEWDWNTAPAKKGMPRAAASLLSLEDRQGRSALLGGKTLHHKVRFAASRSLRQ